MDKELTDGFDVKARLAEGFLSAFAQRLTPLPATRTVTWKGHSYELEVHFHLAVPRPPQLETYYDILNPNDLTHLRLLPAVGNQSMVELHFPFRARIATLGFEKTAEARTVVAAQVQSGTDGEGNPVTLVEVDLSQLSSGQFDFHPHLGAFEWMDKDFLFWKAYLRFPQQLFEEEVHALVIDSLRAIQNEPITPRTAAFGFVTFRTYTDGQGDPQHEADASGTKRLLGIFANQEASETIPAPPLTFTQPPLSTAPAGTNLRLFIPAEILLPLLEQAKNEAIAGIEEVDIAWMEFELHNGYIRVTGEADDATFELEIGLSILPSGDIGAKVLTIVEIDLPWYVDMLNAFPFGSYIEQAIRLAAVKALKSGISGASSDSFAQLSIFSAQLEEIPGPLISLLVTIQNKGDLTIRSNGIVIPGRVSTQWDFSSLQRPERVWGHHGSKEFHRADCQLQMSRKNIVPFSSPAAAIHQGFNGCAYCSDEYHMNDLEYGYLRIQIHLQDPAASHLQASFWLERTSPVTIHDVTVTPSMRFTASDSKKDSTGAFEVTAPVDLFSGMWKLQIARGPWELECEIDIPPRTQRQYVRVNAEAGSSTCETEVLTIPEGQPLSIGKLRM
jgi:hypothetical protein